MLKRVGGWFYEAALWLALLASIAAMIAHPPTVWLPRPGFGSKTALCALAVLAYLIARRRRARRAWAWALMAFVLLAGGGLAVGRQWSRHLAVTERFYDEIAVFDPEAAAQLRVVMDNRAATQAITTTLLKRAIPLAPDADIVSLFKMKLTLLSPAGNLDVRRCVVAAGGTADRTGSPSLDEKRAAFATMGALFRAAADRSRPAVSYDPERARMLLREIYSQVDPSGAVSSPAGYAALADGDKCETYLKVMNGVMALPMTDSALVLRYMSANSGRKP
jgi:hypothetical protein